LQLCCMACAARTTFATVRAGRRRGGEIMKLARSATAALLACSACKDEAAVTTITIGQVIDRTGSIATPSWSDSIRLAVGTANQALKQAGQPQIHFALVDANSGNSPDMARAGALQVVHKQGAKAVI